jgi:hypothetical protein
MQTEESARVGTSQFFRIQVFQTQRLRGTKKGHLGDSDHEVNFPHNHKHGFSSVKACAVSK